MGQRIDDERGRVFLVRGAREALAKLTPGRREALTKGFLRVGHELLTCGERATVDASWARRTWPRRRYPQQCYHRTARYVLDHPDVEGLRLVHGVASHAPLFVPFDHAWVLLPGAVVFDGVVQAFFTQTSYYALMSAVALSAYTTKAAQVLIAERGHPGPWNAIWVPTAAQLAAYADAIDHAETAPLPAPSATVGKNR